MEEQKPEHHKVRVIRIDEITKHPNADTLSIIKIPGTGYRVITKTDDFKIGDLAYYIPPEMIVPTRPEYSILWNSIILPDGTFRDGMKEVPPKYRVIKVRRFRKLWSEGLLMPFKSTDAWAIGLQEGEDISDILGIVHYSPPEPEDLGGQNERGPKSPWPRSWKGWLWFGWHRLKGLFGFHDPTRGSNERGPKTDKPYYDIENWKHFTDAFQPGEQVWVSEKIHGCQGRYVYQDGHMYAGSRRLWKSKNSRCIWRKALEQNSWIEKWCRQNEGFTLYGELIPCQGENFLYGCAPGKVEFYVFDILTPKEEWIAPLDKWALNDLNRVPILGERIPYDETLIKNLIGGKSVLDNKTIREGIVIKPIAERHVHGLGRLKLKLINPEYLSLN
jgi:hypothetical protein